MTKIDPDKIISGLLGVCVGDALGVSVAFTSREERIANPVTTMQGEGTYNQPVGTWSDDNSLTLCLAEAIAKVGFNEDYFRADNLPRDVKIGNTGKLLSCWQS